MKKIIFNGVSSEDLGLVIQSSPTFDFPERVVETTSVPGRNGDIVIDKKSYKNTQRSYNIARVYKDSKSVYDNGQVILDWLASGKYDYRRLEDDYDIEHYRYAKFTSGGQIVNVLDGALTFSLTFECKPQRYYKTGDKPVTFEMEKFSIENPTQFPSKPTITVEGIEYSPIKELMLTIRDSDGDVTSTITMSNVDNGSVTIDSEEENCVDPSGDANDKVSMNGKEFPTLSCGLNNIEIKTYEKEYANVSSYRSLIGTVQEVCKSVYKPYDSLESAKQRTCSVPSYNNLVTKIRRSYLASSYWNLLAGVCPSYEVESVNTKLKSLGDRYTFNGGDAGSQGSCDFLNFTDNSTTGNVTIIAKKDGYYLLPNEKYITKQVAGDVLTEFKTRDSKDVLYYPIVDGGFYLGYDDLPEWLTLRVNYNDKSQPISIDIIANQTGYYYKTKESSSGVLSNITGILAKFATAYKNSKWRYYNTSNDAVLDTLNWNGQKKAFVPKGLLSTSTTATYSYQFISATEEPQYEWSNDTKTYDMFEFEIAHSGERLESVIVTAKSAGYYAIAVNGEEAGEWNWKETGQQIDTLASNVPFEVYYLEKLPNYAQKNEWKKWLSKYPIDVKTGTNPTSPNVGTLTFTVETDGWYRYSYYEKNTTSGDEEKKISEWTYLTKGSKLPMEKTVDESFDVYGFSSKPTEYVNDRCYNDSENAPEYLVVNFKKEETEDTTEETEDTTEETDDTTSDSTTSVYDDTNPIFSDDSVDVEDDYSSDTSDSSDDSETETTIEYVAGKDGYYKWDSNTAWLKKDAGDPLLTTTYKVDTTFYYMPSVPDYPSDEHELTDLFTTIAKTDSTGNPDRVEYKVLTAGYYRMNYDTNWTFYNVGDVMYTASVGELVKVNHLKELNEDLSNINVTIIPRWWTI